MTTEPITQPVPSCEPSPASRSTLIKKILPQGSAIRRLRFGLGRGLNISIDFAFHTRLYFGFYETELNRHIRRLCRPGMNTFDIGGRDGYDALVMAKLTGGRVLSIDCEAAAATQMAANFAANPQLTNQLTARTGFIDSYDSAGIGHITLDTLVAECGFVPDVVKIDIEGWEVEALGGAANLLSSRKPSLIIEVHSADLEKECLVLLADHDYSTEIVDPRRFIPDYRLLAGNRWIIAT